MGYPSLVMRHWCSRLVLPLSYILGCGWGKVGVESKFGGGGSVCSLMGFLRVLCRVCTLQCIVAHMDFYEIMLNGCSLFTSTQKKLLLGNCRNQNEFTSTALT